MALRPKNDKYVESTKNGFLNSIGRDDLVRVAQETPWSMINTMVDTFVPSSNKNKESSAIGPLNTAITELKTQITRAIAIAAPLPEAEAIITNKEIETFQKNIAIAMKTKDPITYQNAMTQYNIKIKSPLWDTVVPMLSAIPVHKVIAGKLSTAMYNVKVAKQKLDQEMKSPEYFEGGEKLEDMNRNLSVQLDTIKRNHAGTPVEAVTNTAQTELANLYTKLQAAISSHDTTTIGNIKTTDIISLKTSMEAIVNALRALPTPDTTTADYVAKNYKSFHNYVIRL